MPKQSSSKRNTAEERKQLGYFIRSNGEIMPRACSNCRKHGRVCKVHARSGRCSECNVHGLKGCDIKITESEWNRLSKQRAKVLAQIKEARAASAVAMEREREAQEALARERAATSTALAKEERLAKQLDLLDKRADNAISVAEASALEAELAESLADLPPAGPSTGLELALSPFTWMSGAGEVDLDASDFFLSNPGVVRFDPSLVGGGTSQEASGSS